MLTASIINNRFVTFVSVDTDLTYVHLATRNCLIRSAESWIIHDNMVIPASDGCSHHHSSRPPLRLGVFLVTPTERWRSATASPESGCTVSIPCSAGNATSMFAVRRQVFRDS
jgi:hypothetical protein